MRQHGIFFQVSRRWTFRVSSELLKRQKTAKLNLNLNSAIADSTADGVTNITVYDSLSNDYLLRAWSRTAVDNQWSCTKLQNTDTDAAEEL